MYLPELEGKFGIESDVELMQFHVVLCTFRKGEVQGIVMTTVTS